MCVIHNNLCVREEEKGNALVCFFFPHSPLCIDFRRFLIFVSPSYLKIIYSSEHIIFRRSRDAAVIYIYIIYTHCACVCMPRFFFFFIHVQYIERRATREFLGRARESFHSCMYASIHTSGSVCDLFREICESRCAASAAISAAVALLNQLFCHSTRARARSSQWQGGVIYCAQQFFPGNGGAVGSSFPLSLIFFSFFFFTL